MKKLLVIMLCAMLIFALPVVASAEGESANDNAQETAATENLTTETITDQISDYITANIDKVVVVIIMIGFSIAESRIRTKMNGSIGTLNNNAIAIANNSTNAIDTALTKVDGIAEKVASYESKFDALIEKLEKSEEEKTALANALIKVDTYLVTAKLANKALADEVAQILNFANIPTSKKDELYKIHVDNVKRLEAEEVKSNDGKEA